MKILFALLFMATSAFAADVKLSWEPVLDAAGYRILMSLDQGVTWQAPVDAGNTIPFTYANVPETGLVLFKIAAYRDNVISWNEFAGAWYDHRKKLGYPTEIGIK
jgi:hypothetical protein